MYKSIYMLVFFVSLATNSLCFAMKTEIDPSALEVNGNIAVGTDQFKQNLTVYLFYRSGSIAQNNVGLGWCPFMRDGSPSSLMFFDKVNFTADGVVVKHCTEPEAETLYTLVTNLSSPLKGRSVKDISTGALSDEDIFYFIDQANIPKDQVNNLEKSPTRMNYPAVTLNGSTFFRTVVLMKDRVVFINPPQGVALTFSRGEQLRVISSFENNWYVSTDDKGRPWKVLGKKPLLRSALPEINVGEVFQPSFLAQIHYNERGLVNGISFSEDLQTRAEFRYSKSGELVFVDDAWLGKHEFTYSTDHLLEVARLEGIVAAAMFYEENHSKFYNKKTRLLSASIVHTGCVHKMALALSVKDMTTISYIDAECPGTGRHFFTERAKQGTYGGVDKGSQALSEGQ